MKNKITFKELEERDYISITDYCRVIVKEKNYPETLEIYRDDMLCLTVIVDQAALLEPSSRGWRLARPRRVSKGSGLI